MDMKLEEATLANIADGHLEEQFQARLQEATGIFADMRPYVVNADGQLTVTIKMEAAFVVSLESQTMRVAVRAELVRPKRKSIVRSM